MSRLSDCGKCMETTNRATRQDMGCGYESRVRTALPWTPHPSSEIDPEDVTTCVGYTSTLPEVIEAVRARAHWSKGSLDAYTLGPCNENLRVAIEILDASANQLDFAQTTPASQGGLRETGGPIEPSFEQPRAFTRQR